MIFIEHIVELVERQPAGTIALSDLHRALVREYGAAAGTYHQLYQRLKQQEHRLLVLENPGPLKLAHGWPPQLLAEYRNALDETMVALREIPIDAPESILPATLATLQSLAKAPPDGLEQEDLAAAFRELEALQRVLAP